LHLCVFLSYPLARYLSSFPTRRSSDLAAQALGYYHLTFEHDLTVTDDCWNMVITLTPGEPVRVTEIRIIINGEGNEDPAFQALRSEEHTSELQSRENLVCRLLLEKKKN